MDFIAFMALMDAMALVACLATIALINVMAEICRDFFNAEAV